jgi:uncharacterized protein (UPF0297 family)
MSTTEHTITLTEDEMMTMEMALMDVLDRVYESGDEETYEQVKQLFEKVTA